MIREVERTSTVIVNAYLRPVLDKYLSTLRTKLDTAKITTPLFICQSTGGLTTAADARRRPVAILESGPAAGVVGAAEPRPPPRHLPRKWCVSTWAAPPPRPAC